MVIKLRYAFKEKSIKIIITSIIQTINQGKDGRQEE